MAGPDLTLKCPECKFNMVLGSANTVLIWVKQHEYMSYIETECPRPACGHTWLTFLNYEDPINTRQLVKSIKKAKWRMKIVYPTPKNVSEQYEDVAGITLLNPLVLNAQQEAHIRVLAWELEDATVQDILDADIENRLPKGWI